VTAAAAVRGFKVVAHFHLDVDPSGSAGFLLPLYKKRCLGTSLRRADRVIALTPAQAEFLADAYRVRPDRLRVVPNAADPAFHLLPDGGGSAAEPLRLLFVGRLDPQKNVGRLIRALSLVRQPVEAAIVGEGEQGAELRRAAAGMGRVRFVGARHGAELLNWFRWADAFVMASDREGMPLALLEAMAAGLVPIVTDVSDLGDLVGDAGLVVATEAAALARGIDYLASDRYLLADLRTRTRRRGGAFSWTRAAEQVRAVYRELAA
jgi:phosphatidylinositol alpha-mannosyltransferase